MKIEISLIEVQEYLATFYNKKVGLKYIEKDTIEVNYYASIVLSIKEVKTNEIVFKYQVNGLAELLAKFIIGKKLENSPIDWDSETNEVIFYLDKVEALSNFMLKFGISSLNFDNEKIVFVIHPKSNNSLP